jgi:hypothetical protein
MGGAERAGSRPITAKAGNTSAGSQPVTADITPHDAAVGKSADQPSRSLLQPQQLARDLLPLDVFWQLHEWASHGFPVDCGNDWSQEAIMMAIQAGPSPTALMPEAKALMEEDLQYKVKVGFTEIIPAETLLQQMPNNLKISWLAMIPQKNCC